MSLKDDVKQLGARLTNGTKSKSAVDAAAIRELAQLLNETGLTEIEIEQDGMRLRVARQAAAVAYTQTPAALPVPAGASAQLAAAELSDSKRAGPAQGAVTSPMVGTAYLSPEPGSPPFVKVGDTVKEGGTLLIVEAMKTMNPIVAPRAGTVSEICINDSQPVEFGQTLLILS